MGCHTWCYAHIPAKQEEWKIEFANTIKDEAIKTIADIESGEISDDLLNEFAKDTVRDCKYWLEDYRTAVADGEENDYIQQFGSREKLEEYINGLHLDENTYTGKELKEEWIEDSKRTIDEIENCTDIIEFMKSGKGYGLSYGSFIIHDGKIYRNTSHYRGPGYGVDYVFEKRFHDIFRIHDYEAKNCYSLEETLKLCEEYNVDWDATYDNSDVKKNDKERLIEFWETYPDSIIEFG